MTATPWRVIDGVLGALLFALTGLAYHEHLTYWWTGPDTFTLITTSRIQHLGDVWSLLTEPMMSPTTFTDLALFYRPTTQLSFALDWALWGLDPTGFHATNLLLHATAVVLTYALARRLLGGHRLRALLAAALFSLHPVVSESLPAISRRQDALATVLLLAALVAYLRSRRVRRHRTGWMLAALGLGLAAFGAKEVALVLPAVVAGHAWLVDPQRPGTPLSRSRLAWAVRRTLPFAVVWAGFVAVRTWVLGGLGGYTDRPEALSLMVAWQQGQYINALFVPLRYLQRTLDLTGTGVARMFAILTVFLVVAALVLYRGRPTELTRDLTRLADRPAGRATGFCLVWIAAGAGLFLAARTFTFWSAYLFLVPASLLVGVLFGEAVAALARARRSPTGIWRRRSGPAALAAVLVLGTVIASSIALSPAVHGEDAWQTNAEVQKAVLPRFTEEVEALDGEVAFIHARNLTWWHGISPGEPGRVGTVSYFMDFTLEDWLVLSTQGREDVDVLIDSQSALDRWPVEIRLDLTRRDPGVAQLDLTYHAPSPDPAPGRAPAPSAASMR